MRRGEKALYLLAVGTYTDGSSEGVYSYAYDPVREHFDPKSTVRVTNPSYLAFAPDCRKLYAVTENPENPSYLNGLLFDPRSETMRKNSRRMTQGAGPCYLSIDPEGKFVATANYAGGSISIFPLWPHGELKPLSQLIRFSGTGSDPKRQEAPHIHCVGFSPEGTYLFATDLGTDRLYRYTVDRTSRKDYLREDTRKDFPVPPGSGPRHFRFSPDGKFLYLINELSATLMTFSYDDGELRLLQTIPINPSSPGDGGDLAITPDGKYLYASLREGNDGIGAFSIDERTGHLTGLEYIRTARHPRNLSLTPDGRFLFCTAMKGHRIDIYAVDRSTGHLRKTDGKLEIDSPVCVVFSTADGIPETETTR